MPQKTDTLGGVVSNPEGEYPREWYCADGWRDAPLARMFTRETGSYLFAGGRRYAKATSYEKWFPTREEAQAVIDARLALAATRRAEQRIRDAAPDLLEALEDLFVHGDVHIALAGNPNACEALDAKCRTAIAKARGLHPHTQEGV